MARSNTWSSSKLRGRPATRRGCHLLTRLSIMCRRLPETCYPEFSGATACPGRLRASPPQCSRSPANKTLSRCAAKPSNEPSRRCATSSPSRPSPIPATIRCRKCRRSPLRSWNAFLRANSFGAKSSWTQHEAGQIAAVNDWLVTPRRALRVFVLERLGRPMIEAKQTERYCLRRSLVPRWSAARRAAIVAPLKQLLIA